MTNDEPAASLFERVYRTHHPAVMAYCLRRVPAPDAHDVASEVFTIAWRKVDSLPSEEKVGSWLYGIAYRVLSHHWRSRNRRRRLAERMEHLGETTADDPATVVVRRAEDRRVIDAAGRLGWADQEILRLAGWERLPHAEIAAVLGISVAAVDQRFHRAKKRLAREYERVPAGSAAADRSGGMR